MSQGRSIEQSAVDFLPFASAGAEAEGALSDVTAPPNAFHPMSAVVEGSSERPEHGFVAFGAVAVEPTTYAVDEMLVALGPEEILASQGQEDQAYERGFAAGMANGQSERDALAARCDALIEERDSRLDPTARDQAATMVRQQLDAGLAALKVEVAERVADVLLGETEDLIRSKIVADFIALLSRVDTLAPVKPTLFLQSANDALVKEAEEIAVRAGLVVTSDPGASSELQAQVDQTELKTTIMVWLNEIREAVNEH